MAISDEQLDQVIVTYEIRFTSVHANRETVLALAQELKAARAEIKALRASGPVQMSMEVRHGVY